MARVCQPCQVAGDDQRGGGVEWLGVGVDGGGAGGTDDGSHADAPRRPRGPLRPSRWTVLVLLVVAGAVAALLVGRHNSGAPTALASSAPPSVAAPAPHRPAVTPVIPSFPGPTPVSPAVINVKAPILGITAGYELFAGGPGAVVRVRFAAGQVTVSELPESGQGGLSAILVGTHAVLLRSGGGVTSYLLPDAGRPHRLDGELANAPVVVPGPDPGSLWVMRASASQTTSLRLENFRGRPTPTRMRLPAGFFPQGPDGAGYVIASGPGGVYDARPGGLTRISHGALLAAGPSGWLARECDRHAHCGDVYIDRSSGSRHRLPVDTSAYPTSAAAIAPGGHRAAFLNTQGSGNPAVVLMNLSTGARRTMSLHLPMWARPGQLAWSPDGRWLFAAAGGLRAIDTRTGRVSMLPSISGSLRLSQVAIRPAR